MSPAEEEKEEEEGEEEDGEPGAEPSFCAGAERVEVWWGTRWGGGYECWRSGWGGCRASLEVLVGRVFVMKCKRKMDRSIDERGDLASRFDTGISRDGRA